MTTKKLIFSTVLIALGIALSLPPTKAFAADQSDCGLGATEAGRKACKAMKQIILFAAHPVGDVDWVIENANGAIDRARAEGVPNIVLAQMLLPSLITKALFADAERHVVAIELTGIVPPSFIAETEQAIKRAAAAGADVSDLKKRLLAETSPVGQAETKPPS